MMDSFGGIIKLKIQSNTNIVGPVVDEGVVLLRGFPRHLHNLATTFYYLHCIFDRRKYCGWLEQFFDFRIVYPKLV